MQQLIAKRAMIESVGKVAVVALSFFVKLAESTSRSSAQRTVLSARISCSTGAGMGTMGKMVS